MSGLSPTTSMPISSTSRTAEDAAAEIRVLVHLEREQHADLLGVASELTEAPHREIPGRRGRRRDRGARPRSRTTAAHAARGQRAMQPDRDDAHTPLGGQIDAPVAVGEVLLPDRSSVTLRRMTERDAAVRPFSCIRSRIPSR